MTQAGQSPLIPPPPPARGANIVTPEVLTSRDVAALRARGEELSNQLQSAASRRAGVQRSLRSATGADKTFEAWILDHTPEWVTAATTKY